MVSRPLVKIVVVSLLISWVNLPPHHVVGNNAFVYGGEEGLQVRHEFWNFYIDNLILIHNDILETNK